MADLRVSFPTLEDSATQAGLPLHKVLEGDSLTSKNAHAAFVAKDGSGAAKYLLQNDLGETLVSMEGNFVGLSDKGQVSGNLSIATIFDIPLQNDYVYKNISFLMTCLKDAEFEVVQIDDSAGTPVETSHFEPVTTPGNTNIAHNAPSFTFTAGSTGVCVLRVRTKNLYVASDFRASLSIQEVQPA